MIRSVTSPRSIGWFDVLVAGIVTAAGVALMVLNVVDPDPGIDASTWVVVPGFLLVTIPVLWRRVAPLEALAAVAVAMAINVAFLGEAVRCGVAIPLVWLLVFSAGARLDLRGALIGFAVGTVALLVMSLNDGAVNPGVIAVFTPVTAAVWSIGRLVHSRGRMVQELQRRTEELRRARDDRARLEVATDRA